MTALAPECTDWYRRREADRWRLAARESLAEQILTAPSDLVAEGLELAADQLDDHEPPIDVNAFTAAVMTHWLRQFPRVRVCRYDPGAAPADQKRRWTTWDVTARSGGSVPWRSADE